MKNRSEESKRRIVGVAICALPVLLCVIRADDNESMLLHYCLTALTVFVVQNCVIFKFYLV